MKHLTNRKMALLLIVLAILYAQVVKGTDVSASLASIVSAFIGL